MKLLKPALTIAFLLGSLACAGALARPGHGGGNWHGGPAGGHWAGHPAGVPGHGYYHHDYRRGAVIGLALGAPLFWPGYGYGWGDPFYDPYYDRYYFSRPLYLPPAEAGGPPTSWYCRNPAGYYPNVTECLVPWRAVVTP